MPCLFRFSSPFFNRRSDVFEQLLSRVVQRQGSDIVAHLCRLHIQLFERDAILEIFAGFGERFEFPVRRHHVLVAVFLVFFSLGIRNHFREETWSVEIDIRVEETGAEGVDQAGALLRDMGVPRMLADDRVVPRFRQCVVIPA